MRKTIVLALLYIGLAAATSDLWGYMPRGWRPNGRSFNPDNNRLHAYYGSPGLRSYYYHVPADTATTHRAPLFTTTTTTRPRTVATTAASATTTTTTPFSREPTTETPSEPPGVDYEDANPPLAIANSFAFNRPVYIYNAFPFLPARILAK